MLHVSESTIIAQPPAVVFATAADPYLQLRWDTKSLADVEQLTPGPRGLGTRYRGHAKDAAVTDYELVEYEPGHRFTQRSVLSIGEIRHSFSFEPLPEGTQLVQQVELHPTLWGQLLQPLLAGRVHQRLREIAAGINQYLMAH